MAVTNGNGTANGQRQRAKTMTATLLDRVIEAATNETAKDKPLTLAQAVDYMKPAISALIKDKNFTIEQTVEWLLKQGVVGAKDRVRKEISRVMKAEAAA